MPRQSRIGTTGALHHIIARGIERRNIFEDDQDRYDFLKNLELILEYTETAYFAWSLMSNHFHFPLGTGAVPLATVMRRLREIGDAHEIMRFCCAELLLGVLLVQGGANMSLKRTAAHTCELSLELPGRRPLVLGPYQLGPPLMIVLSQLLRVSSDDCHSMSVMLSCQHDRFIQE
jgi:hypothetical protein